MALSRLLDLTELDVFEKTLDLLAWDLGIIGAELSSEITKEQAKIILDNFSYNEYKNKNWDLIGEYYESIQERKQLTDFISKEDSILKSKKELTKNKKQVVFDPCCGPGRWIITSHDLLGENGFYMACEDNNLLYKIALLNIVILEIPAAIINADASQINVEDEINWETCNEWVN